MTSSMTPCPRLCVSSMLVLCQFRVTAVNEFAKFFVGHRLGKGDKFATRRGKVSHYTASTSYSHVSILIVHSLSLNICFLC